MTDLATTRDGLGGAGERRIEEAALCWGLRRQGLELREIAKVMTDKGYPMSHVTVKRRLELRAADQYMPSIVEGRQEMALQYDYLYRRTIANAGPDVDLDGRIRPLHPRVAEVASNILEKKAKLLGLPAPVMVDLQVTTGMSAESELSTLAKELGFEEFNPVIEGEVIGE